MRGLSKEKVRHQARGALSIERSSKFHEIKSEFSESSSGEKNRELLHLRPLKEARKVVGGVDNEDGKEMREWSEEKEHLWRKAASCVK